ncbi:MAG TPA: DUF3943 domain-containing protein [Candidatus Aminicenantes bacterium]|nr:MAG: hypothetical protein C0168_08715 [Candidatus Aminicenantes bacterium]HEK85736.1 DUF3943 domain-containing protein [Candidatus Aminicenantes bacterium]
MKKFLKMASPLISFLLFSLFLINSFTYLSASPRPKDKDLKKKFISGFNLGLNSPWGQNEGRPEDNNSEINFALYPDYQISPVFIPDPVKYQQLADHRPKRLRASVEFGAMWLTSAINYWSEYSKFLEDWQYRLNWHDQKIRFFTLKANRFDTNDFGLNWRHSLAGMLYYEFARSNNLPWWDSLLFSVGGSLAWEYVAEWREVISINDNIMTGLGGYVLGESWFQIGKYFLNSPRGLIRLLGWSNPLLKLNGWFARHQVISPYFNPYNYQDQDVFISVGYRNSPTSTSSGNTGNTYFHFGSRIITDECYGLPGKINETFTSPIYSQLDFSLMYHGQTQEELELEAKVVPWGRLIQNISEDRKGYSLYYGLGSAFLTYVKKPVEDYDAGKVSILDTAGFHFDQPRNFRDKLGATHILGPVFEAKYYFNRWSFRLNGEAYLSFGMINSLALNKYSLDHDVQGMKTTLTCYGYYYGLGPALGSSAEISYSPVRLTGFVNYVYYRSIQGLAELQKYITDDSVVKDSRWHSGIQLQVQLPKTDLSLFSSIEWVRRWGRLHEVSDHTLETRYYLGLKYNL